MAVTNGCFDLLHAGHIEFLTKAKRLGDRLIVLVNGDDSVYRLKGEGRPVIPLAERMVVLDALGAVDFVTWFDGDTPKDLICAIRPHVLVKGSDYSVDQIAGADCVIDAGGTVELLDNDGNTSTTKIIGRMK